MSTPKKKHIRITRLVKDQKKLFLILVPLIIVLFLGAGYLISQEKKSIYERYNIQFHGLSVASTEYLIKNYNLYGSSPTLKFESIVSDYLRENTNLKKFAIMDTSGKVVFDSDDFTKGSITNRSESDEVIKLSRKNVISTINENGKIKSLVSPFFEDWGSHKYTVIFYPSYNDANSYISKYTFEIMIITSLLTVVITALISTFVFIEQSYIKSKEKSELEKINKQRREFLVLATHNLRTPLTSIKGYLSMFTETKLSEDQAGLIIPMDDSVEKLGKIIESIIAITNVEIEPKAKIQKKDLELLTIASETLEKYTESIESKNLKINVEIEPKDLSVNSSEKYLRLILDAVISNSIKFNKNDGNVDIRAGFNSGNVRISIQDTGVGIKETDSQNVYRIFHKGSSSDVLIYEYDGAGVGLYMAKLLTEYLGGTINFESTVGKGTTFYIDFPSL